MAMIQQQASTSEPKLGSSEWAETISHLPQSDQNTQLESESWTEESFAVFSNKIHDILEHEVNNQVHYVLTLKQGSMEQSFTNGKVSLIACQRCRKRRLKCGGPQGENGSCARCQDARADGCIFLRIRSEVVGSNSRGLSNCLFSDLSKSAIVNEPQMDQTQSVTNDRRLRVRS